MVANIGFDLLKSLEPTYLAEIITGPLNALRMTRVTVATQFNKLKMFKAYEYGNF